MPRKVKAHYAEPRLHGLSVEILEAIAKLLSLEDLCNLRLTSNETAAKSSQGHFKTYFRHIQLDPGKWADLETFKNLTQADGLGYLVEKVTLRRQLPSEGSRVGSANNATLVDCFRNLKANLKFKCLNELVLDVETGEHPPEQWLPMRRRWKDTWALAGDLYRGTVAALRTSELPVTRLSVFGDSENCSLALDELASGADFPSASFASLKSLSLSLTHSMKLPPATSDLDEEQASAPSQNHVDSLEAMLKLCPCLESLNLHWFMTWSWGQVKHSAMLCEESSFFDRIATTISFENLTSCSLRGVDCTATSLSALIENTPKLQHVSLIHIHLTSGLWRPILDALVAHKLESLHLEDICETNRTNQLVTQAHRLYFVGVPGRNFFQPALGSHELSRKRPDTELAIRYQLSRRRTKASAALHRYMIMRQWLYGPIEARRS